MILKFYMYQGLNFADWWQKTTITEKSYNNYLVLMGTV